MRWRGDTQSGLVVHHAEDATEKLIFVMSPSKTLYVALKERSRFHHSSFLSGGKSRWRCGAKTGC